MKIKERNPELNNVYPEIGSSFGLLSIAHPVMCQHLIGKNVKHYGSDHVIWEQIASGGDRLNGSLMR